MTRSFWIGLIFLSIVAGCVAAAVGFVVGGLR
jgi:hypothetical protein